MSTRSPIGLVLSGSASLSAIQAGNVASTRDHLAPASGLHRLVRRNVEHERIEDMPVALHLIAVDVPGGEELRPSSGPSVEAVLASASIPAVLPPPCPLTIPPIDFDHADTLIHRGYSDAREFLDGGGAQRPRIRVRMRRHTTTARNPNDPVAV